MRVIPFCVLLVLSFSLTFAQSEQLPEILKASTNSEFEARQMGAQVFKLLPRGMFKDLDRSYRDEDNPIGIRGGGAFFSFATGLHSYNKIPQISLLEDGRFSVGFYGASYGFFADLGRRGLIDLDSSSPEANYFLSYKPPQYEKDFHNEYITVHGRQIDELRLYRYLPAISGHAYLLRAISWNESDTVVAFQVLKIDKDGSATIAWKKVADFGKPFQLSMPDEDLQKRVSSTLSEENLVDVEFTVKNNWLYVRGLDLSLNKLERALKVRGIRFRGMGGRWP
jgi:hypothetical protein